MHDFYTRIQTVFSRAGSNRNQFCKKYGHSYQALQAYWNTDKLPPGKILEDLAGEYHVSLDALVLGKSQPEAMEDGPVLARIIWFLRQQDEESLLRIEGALQMFRYLALAGAPRRVEPGLPPADLEIMPAKTEKTSQLLSKLAQIIRGSDMEAEKKKAAREALHEIITNVYEREIKDDWAELEELP
jgi:hypothetical protein